MANSKIEKILKIKDLINSKIVKVESKYIDQENALRRQLDEIDELKQKEIDEELGNMTEILKSLEKNIMDDVLKAGESIKSKRVNVSFYKGRETFDSKKLNDLAKDFPKILECKKIGKPTARITYKEA